MTAARPSLRGLYAITPDASAPSAHRSDRSIAEQVAEAIRGGAQAIQYRDKGKDGERRSTEARALAALCRAAGVPLIVNDDLDLAVAAGAQGVHLGRDDVDPREARARLGPHAIVGVSCYNRLDLAIEAERSGASYAAFGSFFPSPTKPDAVRATPELLVAARARLRIPLVAIGGITPENGGPLIGAGARMLAVVSGVFAARDIVAAARAYRALFHSTITIGGASPPEDLR